MKLIGLSGKKQSGKDTVARYLKVHHGCVHMAFAHSLKEAARTIFGMTEEHTDGALKEEMLPIWGLTPRQIMQQLGTEAMRGTFGDEVWIKSLFTRAAAVEYAVISDVRFLNEAQAIRNRGGILVRIERAGLISTDTHPSETALDDFDDFDHVLLNDGTVEDLFRQIDRVL